MNHPNREEWMSFLYQEVDPAEKSRLSTHLQECASCQEQVARWRGTMGALDQWNLNAAPKVRLHQPWLRWAAAAAVLLAVGITIGAGISRSDTSAMKKDLETQRALIAELTQTIEKNRAQDQQALVVTLRELEARRAAEMQAFRGDLETVAALTQDGLNHAQNQLVRLASYTGAR